MFIRATGPRAVRSLRPPGGKAVSPNARCFGFRDGDEEAPEMGNRQALGQVPRPTLPLLTLWMLRLTPLPQSGGTAA